MIPEGHPQQAGLFTSGVIEASLLFEADLIVAIGFDQVEPMPTSMALRRTGGVGVRGAGVRHARADLGRSDRPTRTHARPCRRRRHAAGGNPTRVPPRLPTPEPRWPPRAPADSDRSNWLQRSCRQLRRRRSRRSMPAPTSSRSCRSGRRVAPLQLLISNGLATMGFALPAAIAAALARPGTAGGVHGRRRRSGDDAGRAGDAGPIATCR